MTQAVINVDEEAAGSEEPARDAASKRIQDADAEAFEPHADLINDLWSENPRIRCHAMVELGILGNWQALTQIDRMTGNADVRERCAVAGALIQFGDRDFELPGARVDHGAPVPEPHSRAASAIDSKSETPVRSEARHRLLLLVVGAVASAVFVIAGIWMWRSGAIDETTPDGLPRPASIFRSELRSGLPTSAAGPACDDARYPR